MTSSDFNMLRQEAPRDVFQITDGTTPTEQALELANLTVWLRTLARQQKQADRDLEQLTGLYGDTIDCTDQRIQRIEQAYQTMAEGTRYVYDQVSTNKKIAETWVHSELAVAANAYQALMQEVWQAIIE